MNEYFFYQCIFQKVDFLPISRILMNVFVFCLLIHIVCALGNSIANDGSSVTGSFFLVETQEKIELKNSSLAVICPTEIKLSGNEISYPLKSHLCYHSFCVCVCVVVVKIDFCVYIFLFLPFELISRFRVKVISNSILFCVFMSLQHLFPPLDIYVFVLRVKKLSLRVFIFHVCPFHHIFVSSFFFSSAPISYFLYQHYLLLN